MTVTEFPDFNLNRKNRDNLKVLERQNDGFTLLEILIAIFIFSLLVTTLLVSYRALFVDTDEFESSTRRYEMAATCLNRMTRDIQLIYVHLPPLYRKPGLDSEPDVFRVVSEPAAVGDIEYDTLMFSSRAHVSFKRPRQNGIATIRYYITAEDQGNAVLRRADTLYPMAPYKENSSDPIICENVKALNYRFYNHLQEEFETWDSESADFNFATPTAIAIEIEVGDTDSSRFFKTGIQIPTTRGPLD